MDFGHRTEPSYSVSDSSEYSSRVGNKTVENTVINKWK